MYIVTVGSGDGGGRNRTRGKHGVERGRVGMTGERHYNYYQGYRT